MKMGKKEEKWTYKMERKVRGNFSMGKFSITYLILCISGVTPVLLHLNFLWMLEIELNLLFENLNEQNTDTQIAQIGLNHQFRICVNLPKLTLVWLENEYYYYYKLL